MADVVELIKADHREVERLFEKLRTSPVSRALDFPVVCSLLIAHSRAEETEVYPVAKSEAGQTDEVAHSQGEHAEAEHLLEQMAALDTDSAQFERLLEELIEAVTHHVEEEESKVLPGMSQRLSASRRHELGEAFVTARTEHLGDRPGQATKQQRLQEAANADLSGMSSASKDEIKEALLEKAEQSSE